LELKEFGTIFDNTYLKRIMKTLFLTILFAALFNSLILNAQNVPSVTVKTLSGESFNTKDISNDGKPYIISFWATWCKPCIKELNTIAEVYEDWQKETGVKLITISIDDTRNSQKVAPFVSTQAWDYDNYLDSNGDFKRAMNVNTVPHTFLFDGKGNIVWQHTSYNPGDEDELLEKIKALNP
jgi:cytochrome c biogenesis protein CcmG/thiol:disulfide interchange protein DsbE